MFKKLIISTVFFITLFLPSALPAMAQINEAFVDTTSLTASGTNKYETGDYTLNDLVLILVRASRWILGIVGSLTLIMFVYGGFMFLISAGSSEKVSKATSIIVAAAVGLVIVFCSYLIIQFVLKTVGINWDGTQQTISRSNQVEILS